MPSEGRQTQFTWASERHLRLAFGPADSLEVRACVRRAASALENAGLPALVGITPAYATILLEFDVGQLEAARTIAAVQDAIQAIAETAAHAPPRIVEIPVCYEDPCAPDAPDLARLHGMNLADVSRLHAEPLYLVEFIGFAPGFAYLSGLPSRLATPRLPTPRVRVPVGSVGIAGDQTGIYATPGAGGWRLIGRTPLAMFDAQREPPTLLAAGDRVRFIPISPAEFEVQSQCRSGPPHSPSSRPVQYPDVAQSPSGSPALRVIEPGLLTSVQDLGRPGWTAVGVARGGAVDALSLRIGNRLVGNEDGAAALEMTLLGGKFECRRDLTAVLAGGAIQARIEGRGPACHVSPWVPFKLAPGERLLTGPIRRGVRSYLCVAGGILVPPVLKSRSTHLAGEFGGLTGRPLRAGDQVDIGEPSGRCGDRAAAARAAAFVDPRLAQRSIRAVEGPHCGTFDPAAVEHFWSTIFEVSMQSDRVGLRLNGQIGRSSLGGRMPSEGMAHGAVQVPESGAPIVLLADHPTTGGYPLMACVAAVDLPVLGQIAPRETVRFERVTVDRARELYAEQERLLDREVPRP